MRNQNLSLRRIARLALHPLLNERGEAGSGDGKEDQKVVMEIDGEEKTFTADDITNLLAQGAASTQKSQQVAGILQAAERYGVSVEQYLQNAEGTFGVMSKLMDEGIIDEKGTIIQKAPGDKPGDDKSFGDLFGKSGETPPAGAKQMEVTMKALLEPMTKQLDSLTESNLKLRSDNVNLMRLRLSDNMQSKYTNLNEEDVVRIFSVAERDKSESLMAHAEAWSKKKMDGEAELEAEFAKKYNIDIEKANENAAFEQDPSGGAAAISHEKKLSFKKGEKDSITPVQATKAFFNKFEGFKP